jgi:low affinity Fe/Cu permease
VFLIQNTQNRDTEALQLKLDELIRVNRRARNSLLELEDLTDDELEHVKKTFTRLARSDSPPAGEPADPQIGRGGGRRSSGPRKISDS